jgi:gamma-glutamyltranspeptidase/glutathione hydrolase
MTYWHLDEDHIDCLEPGKRVRHTMNPVMVFEGDGPASEGKPAGDGKLMLVCGTPGADTQVQTNMQVITHLIDFGMTVAEAVEAPRWRNSHSPTESNIPHVCDNLLHMESRFGTDVRQALESRGHQLNMMPDWGAQGSEMMIQVNPETGALQGAADPRRDGYAIGW